GPPYTRSRAPLRRRAPFAWHRSLRSLAMSSSEADGVELLQHVLDASTDLFALGLERSQLGAGSFALGDADARALELGAQPTVLVFRARQLRPGLLETPDELFQFLFEPIDRLEFNRTCYSRLRHALPRTQSWGVAPCTLSRAPLRRRAAFAWLTR